MMARPQAHKQTHFKRSAWTPEEDLKLIEYVKRHNKRGVWKDVSKLSGLNRCGNSCRQRWNNYLSPDIKKGSFSKAEEVIIIGLQSFHGNKWALISTQLPGRTGSDIKNYWNTRLKKKLLANQDPLVTQTPSQQLLNTADSLDYAANYLRSCAMKSHPDAQHPVLQGFDYFTPNPHTQLHELGFDSTDPQDLPSPLPPQGTRFINTSTDPAQTRPSPPQGPSVNYQAMEDPTVHNYPGHFGPLITKTPNTDSIPDQKNNNHAGDVGSLFWNVPNAGSTPALMVSASSEFSMTNEVEKEIAPLEEIFLANFASQACLTKFPMERPPEFSMANQVENEIIPLAEEISIPLSTSISCEAFWTEPTVSPELCMTNQIENEINPPAEEISNLLSTSTTFETSPELLMGNETTDFFWKSPSFW